MKCEDYALTAGVHLTDIVPGRRKLEQPHITLLMTDRQQPCRCADLKPTARNVAVLLKSPAPTSGHQGMLVRWMQMLMPLKCWNFTCRAVTVRRRPVWPPESKGAVARCRGTCSRGAKLGLQRRTQISRLVHYCAHKLLQLRHTKPAAEHDTTALYVSGVADVPISLCTGFPETHAPAVPGTGKIRE